MSAREKDLNPDVFIGLQLPLDKSLSGFFKQTKTTLEQTKYNIINLLHTIKGERLGQPTFGSSIHYILFEPMTEDIEAKIEESINESISEWLPYVTIKEIKFDHAHELDNQITVNVIFTLAFEPDKFGEVVVNFETFKDVILGE